MFKETPKGVIIKIRVVPNASTTGFAGINAWSDEIKVKVKRPADKGKANAALMDFFKNTFNTDVTLISGHTARHKTILLHGLGANDVRKHLG